MNYNEMSKEELIQLLEENENSTGKYGLIWDKEKEPEKIVAECHKNIPILKEMSDKKILNDNFINNLLIEGDNFHSLSVLNYTHKEKIDVIYIDPPYNTGNKDFMYNDNFIELDDGYRHSKWLSFISKRLKLAKELLKNDGIIFISIDDNEQAQLKLLCDKIFGEKNFIGNVIWHKKTQPSFLTNELITVTEFVLVYKKNDSINFFGSYSDLNKAIEMLNLPNKKCERIFKKENICIANGTFTGKIEKGFYGNGELAVELLNDILVEDGIPNVDIRMIGRFKWGQEKIDEALKDGGIIHFKSLKTLRATLVRGASATATIKPPINLQSKLINNMATNTDASNELKLLFDGVNPMSYPKPTKLIKFLIDSVTHDKKDAIILDFFAGSGTTGQAVLELNKEDGGHRQFILCTNNENGICENITYERLKKVINGYKEFKALGGNLKYYKCEFVENSNNRDQLYFDLTEKCIPMLCVKENNFIEYKSTNEYKIFTNESKSKFTCIYYSLFGEKENEFIKELEQIENFKIIYKFSLGDTVDTSLFKSVNNYIVEAIPYRIVELYKRIVKMSRED